VRHFNLPCVVDKLRITIGTDEHNEMLCKLLRSLVNLRNYEYFSDIATDWDIMGIKY
jgi:hypothetical protein